MHAFDEVAETLDLIEGLAAAIVIPGHGQVFSDVSDALANARRRLDGFVRDPEKHATHAAKVLLKFKLLELRQLSLTDFNRWTETTPYFGLVHQRWFAAQPIEEWTTKLVDELVRAGAARREGMTIIDV